VPATPIGDHFQELLVGGLSLGNPQGGEEDLYDGGSMQVYEFGRIYFHPRIGQAFESHGLILDTYLGLFAEQGPLGYPNSDELDDPSAPGGRMNTFEFGTIQFDPAAGITVTPDREPPELIPRVVVKLAEGIGLHLGDGELVDIEAIGNLLGPFAQTPVFTELAELLELAEFRKVFDAVPVAEFQAMIDEAMENDPEYDPPDLLLFLEIDVPDGVDPEALAGLLATWTPVVEDAYVSALPSDPVVGTTNPLFVQQGFLQPSSGVDAPAAWAVGADGSDIRFIDIEQGWFMGHEDLPNLTRVLAGINVPASHGHGTAVLGTVIGQDNNLGGVGIAPGAQTDVMSWASPGEQPGRRNRHTVAKRIQAATQILSSGDVLLLEVQFNRPAGSPGPGMVPVESQTDVFVAIQLAAAKGIVVVEAAANGGGDLDTFNVKGKAILDRTAPDFQGDSGAIMVGACASKIPHGTHPDCNVGSRVDCNAWGDHMVVPGNVLEPDKMDDPFQYHLPPAPDVGDVPFGHTSGASATIAGVCLLVQHLRSILTPADGSAGPLNSRQMRAVLSNPSNGLQLTADKIGPMPSLASIIANEFV
jgi:hypothetical protein